MFAAPTRYSKPLKLTPPTVPVPAPVTVHVLSAAGPWSVSEAPPALSEVTPLNERDEMPPPLIVPAPPSYVQLDPAPGPTLIAEPSYVTGTVTSPAERST